MIAKLGGKVAYRELYLYKGEVSEEEAKHVLDLLFKPLMPLLGFLDFSWLFSITPSFRVVKEGNVVKLFIQSAEKVLKVSHFLFPFRLGKEVKVEKSKAGLCIPGFAFFSSSFVEALIKMDLSYLSFRFFRILNITFGVAKGIRRNGCPTFLFITNPARFLALSLAKHPSIHVEVLEIALNSVAFSSSQPLFKDEFGNTIGLDNFDPIQHTLVIGESGSGKSVFLMMYLAAIRKKYGERVKMLIVDPHGEFAKKFPLQKRVVDFSTEYLDPFTLSAEFSPMMAQLITQLIVDAIDGNKYAERVVFHAVYLLGSLGELSLDNLYALLADEAKRMEYVARTELEEVKAFFDNEFQDIYIRHYDKAILPIINFISEYRLYTTHLERRVELADLLQEHDVVVISFDPNKFSKRMIHFLGSAVISQMYILALTGRFDRPTLLVIDEVMRVQTPVIKNILAETRKYNLFLVMATQYLGQLREDIVNAIVSNVRNIIAFKLHKRDAALLAGSMDLKVEEYFKKVLSVGELEEKKKQLFVDLDAREAVVRLYDGSKYLPPTKTRTVDKEQWLG